jgi:hypothetical protein
MIVTQTGTTSGNSELFFTQNNFRHFDIFNNSNNGLLSLNIGNTTQVSSTIDIITSPPIVVIISVLASTTASMYVNGTLTGVNGAARGVLSLDEDLTWAISGRAFLGSIGEVIAYPTAVTDTERQKVEAYLAWKWGLQSNLPATNPWQLTPPSGESPPGAPTLDVILSGNTVVYIYYTAGTGTATNYQYTTDAGSSYTSFSPPDIVSPNAITDVANGSPITVQFRSYNGGGSSTISNSLTATPSQPAVPAAWLVFDPNNATSYSGSGPLNNIGTFGPLSGTVTGAVTYVTGTGITGKVLNFNGGYVAFPTFNFGSAFTISAWVNPSAKFSINGLLTNGFANANTAGFKFGWNGWQTTNYSMLFENGDGTAGNWYVPSSLINTVTPGVWQMLTVIFDRVGRTSLFLRNGVPVGVYGITTASNMTVTGAFNIGAYMGGTYTMKAELGLLKVYNSALTASQVYDDFLAGTTSFGFTGPPTAPTLSATPGDSSVSIAFTEGATGGSAITNYSYSIDGTTFTPFSPAQTTSPLTVTGLSNGSSYTVYVKAINVVGASTSPSSVSFSLSAVAPTAPTSLSATAGNTSLSIAFTQGSNGGSAITNYSYSTDGTTFTPFSPAQTSSPVTISGLTNGTTYTVYLKAITSAGTSTASASVTETPVVPAQPWINLDASAGSYNNSYTFAPGTVGSISPFLQRLGFPQNYPFPIFPYLRNLGGTFTPVNLSNMMFNPGGRYNLPGTSYFTFPFVGGNPFILVDVNLPSAPVAVPTRMTITAWINPLSPKIDSNRNIIFSTGGFNNVTNASIPPYQGLVFGWDSNYSLFCATGDGVVPTTGNYRLSLSSNNTVTPGVIQNVTLVFDGVNNVSQFFMNGNAVGGSSNTASNIVGYNQSNTFDVIIGDTDGPYTMSMYGYMGRITVYSTAYTGSEVSSYYAGNRATFNI